MRMIPKKLLDQELVACRLRNDAYRQLLRHTCHYSKRKGRDMLRSIHMTHETEANIFALGFTTIYVLGIITLVIGLFALLWLAFQVVMVLLASIAESCFIIGNLYSGSDALVKLLIICIVGAVAYKGIRMAWRK